MKKKRIAANMEKWAEEEDREDERGETEEKPEGNTEAKTRKSLFQTMFGKRTRGENMAAHFGTKPGHFETSKIHFPTSQRVSEVSERANE